MTDRKPQTFSLCDNFVLEMLDKVHSEEGSVQKESSDTPYMRMLFDKVLVKNTED